MAGGEEIRGGAEAFETGDTYDSISTVAAAVVTETGPLLCGGGRKTPEETSKVFFCVFRRYKFPLSFNMGLPDLLITNVSSWILASTRELKLKLQTSREILQAEKQQDSS
ncbi:hypothetical protein Chor_014973 [Crotalus horridus]